MNMLSMPSPAAMTRLVVICMKTVNDLFSGLKTSKKSRRNTKIVERNVLVIPKRKIASVWDEIDFDEKEKK